MTTDTACNDFQTIRSERWLGYDLDGNHVDTYANEVMANLALNTRKVASVAPVAQPGKCANCGWHRTAHVRFVAQNLNGHWVVADNDLSAPAVLRVLDGRTKVLPVSCQEAAEAIAKRFNDGWRPTD